MSPAPNSTFTNIVISPDPNQNTSQSMNCIDIDDGDCDVLSTPSMSTITGTSCFDCDDITYDLESTEKCLNFRSNVTANGTNGNIGSVCIQSSSEILFGNKTFFNGPVVIKQFVVDSDNHKANQQEQYSDKSEAFDTKASRVSLCCIKAYCLQHRPIFIFAIITIVAIISAFVVAGNFWIVPDSSNSTTSSPSPTPPQIPPSSLSPSQIPSPSPPAEDYEYVNRSQYGALQPKQELEPLSLPIKLVVIAHTVTSNCTNFDVCAAKIRSIQANHMNKWDDIGLNFLVGGDGRAYEGCGFNVCNHTLAYYNTLGICISFIGTFTENKAPEKQLMAARQLIEDGIKQSKIHPDYALYGHRQLKDTLSPGDALYEQIISWPHWKNKIIPL